MAEQDGAETFAEFRRQQAEREEEARKKGKSEVQSIVRAETIKSEQVSTTVKSENIMFNNEIKGREKKRIIIDIN